VHTIFRPFLWLFFLTTAVAVVLAAVLLLLSHSQIGRDQVARQLEARFNAQYHGQLEIGRLTGNLLYDLFARDVRLYDATGRVVLAADSVVIEPRWIALLQDRLELKRITLVRPSLELHRGEDGVWNLADAFRSRRPSGPGGEPLHLEAARVRIIDGRLRTINAGDVPAAVRSGAVFDYTNARATTLNAELDLDFQGPRRRVRVATLSAELPDQRVSLRHLSGNMIAEGPGVAMDDLALDLGETQLRGAFRLVHTDGRDHLDLRLDRSPVHGDEVRRLVPAFPVPGPLVVATSASGPLDELMLDHLDVQRGASTLRASGRLYHLPDSLGYALSVDGAHIRPGDVADLAPEAATMLERLGVVRGDVEARGAIAWSHGVTTRTDARLRLVSDAGAVGGQLRLRTTEGSPARYALDGRVHGFDPGRLTGDGSLAGSLHGRVSIDGSGFTATDVAARIALDLEPSRMGGRTVDALVARGRLDGRRVSGDVVLTAGGHLSLSGRADLGGGAYDLVATTESFDLRSLVPDAPASRLTGTARLEATGAHLDLLAATLDLDLAGSSITLGDSLWALPEEPVRLSVYPGGSEGPRVSLATESFTIDVGGSFGWADMVTAGRFWSQAVANAVDTEVLHRRELVATSPAERSARAPADAHDVDLVVRVHRADAFRPWVKDIEPGSAMHVVATMGPDSLRLGVELSAVGITLGDARFTGLRMGAEASATDAADLLTGLAFQLEAASDSLFPGRSHPTRPYLDVRYAPERRGLHLTAEAFRQADSVRASTRAFVSFLPDRSELAGRFDLNAPGQAWHVEEARVDLYRDALVFRSFEAERSLPNGYPAPRLALRGIASGASEDVLHVVARALDLSEVLDLVGVDLPLDGLAVADLAVTSALGQPAILGTATVDDFSLFGEVAGRLTARSEIIPGRPGFAVDLSLQPDDPRAAVENRIHVAGTLSLPGRTPTGVWDSGFFDLAATFTRLDLFFLDHLFPEIIAGTRGAGTGSGTIRGDWSYPLFDGDLFVRDASTRVPDFNLGLSAEGRVTVDRYGFQFHDVSLRDKRGGSGTVRGRLLFNDYRYFSFDLAAQLTDFEIIDVGRAQAGTLPFYGHIRAGGTATLTGPLDAVYLRSPDAVTSPDSEIFIPVTASGPAGDSGFLVFADTEGRIPDIEERRSLIGERPESERAFLDGLQMSLNVYAPPGSTVHLVFDPIIGDQINAVGSARLQLAIREGEFQTFGAFEVERGDYLFTAGDVFTRRFDLDSGGTIEWDGDPIDARLNLPASYRTRASLAGLGLVGVDERARVPFIVRLDVGGRVTGPVVDLSLDLDEGGGRAIAAAEALRRRLNEPDRQAEYATSVLLTNTFLLAPSDRTTALTDAADDLLFTSLSELVSSRLNLFLNQALGADNLDVAVGVQQRAGLQDLDVTYGVALRLLDERLVIRGEGVYQQFENRTVAEGLQGEVAVEVRIADGVALEVFYRREGDVLMGRGLASMPTGAYGAGVNYQAEFVNWGSFVRRLLGAATEPHPGGAEEVVTVSASAGE
jgi:translocation and assembly module TamB